MIEPESLFSDREMSSAPPAFRLVPQQSAPSLSPLQQQLMEYLHVHQEITLKQATELFGRNLYTNAAHHVGARIKRMVDRGLIERAGKGRYRIATKEGRP